MGQRRRRLYDAPLSGTRIRPPSKGNVPSESSGETSDFRKTSYGRGSRLERSNHCSACHGTAGGSTSGRVFRAGIRRDEERQLKQGVRHTRQPCEVFLSVLRARSGVDVCRRTCGTP